MIALMCRHCPVVAFSHADYEAQGHAWGQDCPTRTVRSDEDPRHKTLCDWNLYPEDRGKPGLCNLGCLDGAP
jgi:hypothetical protein